jgi:hypothetical protein
MAILVAAPIVTIELLGWMLNGNLDGFLIGNCLTMPFDRVRRHFRHMVVADRRATHSVNLAR